VAGPARAEDVAFTLRPEIGVQFGTETFELSAPVQSPTADVNLTASSKLSYPVGTGLVGGSAAVDVDRFSFTARALTNFVNPWGTLLDQDFLTASAGTQSQQVEFSHTDSRTTLRALVVEGAARYRIAELSAPPGSAPLHLVAGLRYESSAYEAFGASGWQLDANANRVAVSLPGDPLGLRYDVRYWLPFVGAGIDLKAGEWFVLSTEGRFIASWSTHDDDHVLRNKRAHASAHGLGFGLAAEPAVEFAPDFHAGVTAEVRYVGALDGHLHQHYYGDDPSLPGDQSTTSIPDSAFSFTSVRVRLLAFVSARF
jgi:hypothetical protein